ncbi:MAG: hypothetical protein IKC97_08660, partial [Clostridia bacterium]|nr:hypothetical protein [Clostridia bacterium]
SHPLPRRGAMAPGKEDTMYMQRDKLISIRVNSKLFNEVKKLIDSRTTVSESWGARKIYHYSDKKRPYSYDKFTVADLLEEKLQEYLNEEKTPSAQK